jgi:signal transduction histidine kinase
VLCLAAIFFVAIIPVPAAAGFLSSSVPGWPLPVLAVGLVLGALSWLALRLRADRSPGKTAASAPARTRTAILLATNPAAVWYWPAAGKPAFYPGSVAPFQTADRSDFGTFLERFAAPDAVALDRAVSRLRREGREFAFDVALQDGSVRFEAAGRRVSSASTGSGDCVVWFLDAGRRIAAETERDRLRTALDAVPLPVWSRSPDLALIACNQAYAAAVEATPETAIAESREIAAGILGAGGRAVAERARSEGTVRSETHHLVISGTRRLLELTETPVTGSGELVGYARDLTEIEELRSELARHIAAHADVLEALATAIAIYGPDRRLKFFNSAFAALWRLEPDWLAAEPTLDEVLEKLRERRRLPEYADFRAFKKLLLALFTSLIEPQEELLHLPDERTLRLVVSPHPLGGLTFAYEDVTDRLALERSYNTLIDVQRETLDNLHEGLAVFGSDGKLKLFNPAYGRIWKLTTEDLTAEPHIADIVEKCRAFFSDDGDWPRRRERIIARVTAHVRSSGQLERRDGSVLDLATVPLPDGNILLSYLDVTDSTRVQRALQERNEALETATRLKSEFIANVSYELRTPLNAVIGFAEILKNQYFGELNPRQYEYACGILDSSHRLLSVVNDILDLATIEAGNMVLETDSVDIHSLMVGILALSRERARKQSLALELDCSPEIGSFIADERRLKQALLNLISNSLRFTQPGGTIRLSAERGLGEVLLSVEDNGPGIPQADQIRVFEKFERGALQDQAPGVGLGLSLVKSFVELHGGTVELVSKPGSGTRVTLHLPVRQEASPGPTGTP